MQLKLSTVFLIQPWLPRLQKAFSNSTESQNESGTTKSEIVDTVEEAYASAKSPEPMNSDLLISPSPLVSWRANCTVGKCRQLFLLTPLPMSKTLSSKHQGPRSAFEKITLDTISQPPLEVHTSENTNDDPEVVASRPKPEQLSYSSESMTRNPLQIELKSPVTSKEDGLARNPLQIEPKSSPVTSKEDHFTIVMTPCFKMSPPKSCSLLEPLSGSVSQAACRLRKSTPYPTGLRNIPELDSSESSGSGMSKGLALKYPELLGIQRHSKHVPQKKSLDASPEWFFSPPKTCVLMEPPDENSLNNQGIAIFHLFTVI